MSRCTAWRPTRSRVAALTRWHPDSAELAAAYRAHAEARLDAIVDSWAARGFFKATVDLGEIKQIIKFLGLLYGATKVFATHQYIPDTLIAELDAAGRRLPPGEAAKLSSGWKKFFR